MSAWVTKKCASRSLARSGAWLGKQAVSGRGSMPKVAENADAGYGRKSRGDTGQGRVRILRRQSELSAKLGNQHILNVGKPRRTTQV